MAGPDRPHPNNLVDDIKNVFDTQPEGEGGIGPTIGQDLDGPKSATRKPGDAATATPKGGSGVKSADPT